MRLRLRYTAIHVGAPTPAPNNPPRTRGTAVGWVWGLALCILLGLPGVAMAEEPVVCPICIKANNDEASYQDKASHTLARGLLNFTLGWTDFIRQPGKAAREGESIASGIALGAGSAITRTISGLGEILTFWTPRIGKDYIHFSRDCPLDAE